MAAQAKAAPTFPTYTSPVLARYLRNFLGKATISLLAFFVLLVFLSPFAYMTATAFKSPDQISAGNPLPLSPITYNYQGTEYPVYRVPADDGTLHEWAIIRKGREESTFVDPANPDAGEFVWQGRWRTLEAAMHLDPQFGNFATAWNEINFPRLLFNTSCIAILGMIGTLLSSIAVAYGFARFPIPGKNVLFLVLIGTIILPTFVTLVPTYTFFARIGWTGTWLPLIVPHFFANAYNVFLLRQFFMTIPRDLDEAAMIDGATPFQILTRVIVPQSTPVIVAVALSHFVFAWNDYFSPLIYLLGSPSLWPISVGIQQFNYSFGTRPHLVQATSLMAMIVPVVIFFFSQRVYLRGVVFTGIDK